MYAEESASRKLHHIGLAARTNAIIARPMISVRRPFPGAGSAEVRKIKPPLRFNVQASMYASLMVPLAMTIQLARNQSRSAFRNDRRSVAAARCNHATRTHGEYPIVKIDG